MAQNPDGGLRKIHDTGKEMSVSLRPSASVSATGITAAGAAFQHLGNVFAETFFRTLTGFGDRHDI